MRALACALALASLFGCATPAERRADPTLPLVIAHRGASGYRPEHTLAAYELAVSMGADYIEPDLCITKDGVLIARHENEISGTTDVATRFPDRKTRKQIEGKTVEGYFTEDFTLVELKTLRARERLAALRDTRFDGQFEVPTLDEILDFVRRKSQEAGRRIGLYIETKRPGYFSEIGLPLEEKLVAALSSRGLTKASDPVFLQSFEAASLRKLRQLTKLRLVQLVEETGAAQVTPAGLAEIATYADGVGPSKQLILPAGGPPTSLIADAHAKKLVVHPWTFRREAQFLTAGLQGDVVAEMTMFYRLGVDGLFSDFPDLARQARDAAQATPR